MERTVKEPRTLRFRDSPTIRNISTDQQPGRDCRSVAIDEYDPMFAHIPGSDVQEPAKTVSSGGSGPASGQSNTSPAATADAGETSGHSEVDRARETNRDGGGTNADQTPDDLYDVLLEPELDGELHLTECKNATIRLTKVVFGLILFAVVWGGAVISKATVVFAASNIRSSNSSGSMRDGAFRSILECVDYNTSLTAEATTQYQPDFSDYTTEFFPETTPPYLPRVLRTSDSRFGNSMYTKCLVLPRSWNKTYEETSCSSMLDDVENNVTYYAEMCDTVAVQWVWCLFLIMVTPYVLVFLRCFWIWLLRKTEWPGWPVLLFGCLMETFYITGLCMFSFVVLPLLDNGPQMMIVMMGVGIWPSIFVSYQSIQSLKKVLASDGQDALRGGHRRNENVSSIEEGGRDAASVHSPLPKTYKQRRHLAWGHVVLSVSAVIFQIIGLVTWPVTMYTDSPNITWSLPLSLFLISCGYWENYIDLSAYEGKEPHELGWFIRLRKGFDVGEGTVLRMVTSLWKSVCAFGLTVGFIMVHSGISDVSMLFDLNPEKHCKDRISPDMLPSLDTDWIWVWLISSSCGFVSYFAGRTAAKILLQRLCYAAPLLLATPLATLLLSLGCQTWNIDPCSFEPDLPSYVFFRCQEDDTVLFTDHQLWLVLPWVFSQLWLTIHVWNENKERLVKASRLFVQPLYDGVLWEQSMLYNRRRQQDDKKIETPAPERAGDDQGSSSNPPKHKVPMIFACATMWHETKTEMNMLMKSIFKLDRYQGASQLAQEDKKIVNKNHFNFEAHIFFDDAVEYVNKRDYRANEYVKDLASVLNNAAREVHEADKDLIGHPDKYTTPYGSRLEWKMPGENKLVAHLKDKQKARHKKRWSQVMYMYYFLEFRTKNKLPIDNTMLLALDGDVDFEPEAVVLLVDLMKRQEKVGAVCGRIHPVGAGPMIWYQKFEYALGHWMQKSTEHVLGCVLCSPGCFSLFRGRAIQDVMGTYTTRSTEPSHFVQYDQGEDRWLCTLLLQAGWKVEYSAAADALTFAPEGFYEFYTQRRRWGPSSMANILDLLESWKATIKENDYISTPYMVYQAALFGSSLMGTGTIFLMIVGALELALGLDIWFCVLLNLVPLVIFVILCFVTKVNTQLQFALILTAAYALLQMIVLVGIILQMTEEGLCSPTSIFFFYVAGTFLLAAILHPQEFLCIVHGFTYYLAIPSMYMLLMIFSITNLNVVAWGTRETSKTKHELQAEEDRAKAEPGEARHSGEQATTPASHKTHVTVGFETSCGSLCRMIWCPEQKPAAEDPTVTEPLLELNNQDKLLRDLIPDLGLIPSNGSPNISPDIGEPPSQVIGAEPGTNRPTTKVNPAYTDNTTHNPTEQEDPVRKEWVQHRDLGPGSHKTLEDDEEEEFFKTLLHDHLAPLEKDKLKEAWIAKELKGLRNKVSAIFLLANGMLIVTLLLLQVNALSVPWPLPCSGEDLSIEPIGFMFLIFYVLIMLIQTWGMLVHRIGAFLHIMSFTRLPCTDAPAEELTKEQLEKAAKEARLVKDDDEDKTLDEAMSALDEEKNMPVRKKKDVYRTMRQAHNARKAQAENYCEQIDNLPPEKREMLMNKTVNKTMKYTKNPALNRAVETMRMKGTIAGPIKKYRSRLPSFTSHAAPTDAADENVGEATTIA